MWIISNRQKSYKFLGKFKSILETKLLLTHFQYLIPFNY